MHTSNGMGEVNSGAHCLAILANQLALCSLRQTCLKETRKILMLEDT